MRCAVCAESADTIRYGVLACRACAEFFRRSIANSGEFVCKHGGGCEVGTASRNICRACRFERCLAVGMTRKGDGAPVPVLQRPRQDSQCASDGSPPEYCSSDASTSPEQYDYVDCSTNMYNDCIPSSISPQRNEGSPQEALAKRMPILEQLIQGYSRLMDKRSNYTPKGVPCRPSPFAVDCGHRKAVNEMDYLNVYDFFLRFYPRVSALSENCKIEILKTAFPAISIFNRSCVTARMYPDRKDRLALMDGNFLDRSGLADMMSACGIMDREEAANLFVSSFDLTESTLTAPLKKIQLSGVEEVAIMALIISATAMNEVGGECEDLAVDVQKEVFRELYEYYSSFTSNEVEKAERISKITSILPSLDRLVNRHKEDMTILQIFAMRNNKRCAVNLIGMA